MLHPLPTFIHPDLTALDETVTYWYQGFCPQTGKLLQLPRHRWVEAIARQLMQDLSREPMFSQEGKMYGVLWVETETGEQRILKAFSGLLYGQSEREGWVPPIPGRAKVTDAESQALMQLDSIKQELFTLSQLPERQEYHALQQQFEQQIQELTQQHQNQKQIRQGQRQHAMAALIGDALAQELERLNEESRQAGIIRRHLKRKHAEAIAPLQAKIAAADARIQALKQQRKTLSRTLQAQMHATYQLTNFAGLTLSLQAVIAGGMPTGTGDCCAPKLLHYAATHQLKPLAMAEFWWGPDQGDKKAGEFYGACEERCRPLMGFLLSGLSERGGRSLPLIYEDEWLIAVNKPAGLLSVPGRYAHCQDSVLSWLREKLPDGENLMPVHRLDQDTSGILLLARNCATYHHLSQQFAERQVHKIYEAVLAGVLELDQGVIDLPLWSDPCDRPRQKVDWQRGKPSVTKFQVMARTSDTTRVEFKPLTGRTHQLRVHAAVGLGMPILGDRLYGNAPKPTRLHLHARELIITHPWQSNSLRLQVAIPF